MFDGRAEHTRIQSTPDRPFTGRPFLTARWTNLFLATYPVPDRLLADRLPPGFELDRREGAAFVSIVAFDFADTRVFGVRWPGYRRFPEVNLRFYVRRGEERGVMFIREFVQSRLIAWIAKRFYNEPYVTMPMSSRVTQLPGVLSIQHRLIGRDRVHIIRATGATPVEQPGPESIEHFFKEHQWGYGRSRRGLTLRYEVSHPLWDIYPIRDYQIDIDWAALYGPEWSVLQGATPASVMLAAGSEVAVFPPVCA